MYFMLWIITISFLMTSSFPLISVKMSQRNTLPDNDTIFHNYSMPLFWFYYFSLESVIFPWWALLLCCLFLNSNGSCLLQKTIFLFLISHQKKLRLLFVLSFQIFFIASACTLLPCLCLFVALFHHANIFPKAINGFYLYAKN